MADGQGPTYPEDDGGFTPSGPARCARCGCPPHTDMSRGLDRECRICGCPPFLSVKRERDEGVARAHGDPARAAEGFH